MFQIRAKQIKAFSPAVQSEFERRAVTYLTNTYPEYARREGDAGLRMLLKQCTSQAERAKLGTENGIVTWAELVICYGDGFDKREPWAGYILGLDADASDRVARLREYL
jgi:hypothetical protein